MELGSATYVFEEDLGAAGMGVGEEEVGDVVDEIVEDDPSGGHIVVLGDFLAGDNTERDDGHDC